VTSLSRLAGCTRRVAAAWPVATVALARASDLRLCREPRELAQVASAQPPPVCPELLAPAGGLAESDSPARADRHGDAAAARVGVAFLRSGSKRLDRSLRR
jgi:hypothetical protein